MDKRDRQTRNMSASLTLSYWLPAQFQSVNDHAEALRIRIFLILILLCIIPLVGLFLILSGISIFGYGDYWQPAIITAVIVLAQTSCLLYFLKSGNINLCSLIYAAIIFILIGIAALLTGGWNSPVCVFMLALPVIACLVVSRMAGLLFSLAVLSLYGGFFLLTENGYAAEQWIPSEFLPYSFIGMWLTTLSFIVGCLFLFDFSTEDLSKAIQQERKQWQKDVDFDELTNMLNPKPFLDLMEREKIAQKGQCQDIAVIYIQINNLKNINQDLGFEAGDCLLSAVARHIKALAIKQAGVSRYSPDSFAIFMAGIDDIGVFISNIFSLEKVLQKNILFRDEILLPCKFRMGAIITSDLSLPANDFVEAAMNHAAINENQIYMRK